MDVQFFAGGNGKGTAPFRIGPVPKEIRQLREDVLRAKETLEKVQVALLKASERKGAMRKSLFDIRADVLSAIRAINIENEGVMIANAKNKITKAK